MKTNNTTLELNLLRRLALMQHLGEDYFIVNGIAYEGSEEDAKTEYDEYLDEMKDSEEAQNDGGFVMEFPEFVEANYTQVEELEEDDYSIDYMVLTDEEADVKWDESLDNYLEECIYPELPDSLSNYFDDEKWKRDAKMDGRGHSLSSYDGNENEEKVEGETFYIYRTN